MQAGSPQRVQPLSARGANSTPRQEVFSTAAQQLLQASPGRDAQGSKDKVAAAKGQDIWDMLAEEHGRVAQTCMGVPVDEVGKKVGKKKRKEVGPLLMRGQGRDQKDHGVKGGTIDTRFMSPEDRELHSICEMIGQKAAMKYRTVREAMRFVDADRDGFVTKSEVEYFFRAYDISSETVAGHLFDRLDTKRVGEIDYTIFVDFMGPFIRGEPPRNFYTAAENDSETSTRESTPLAAEATQGYGMEAAQPGRGAQTFAGKPHQNSNLGRGEWNVDEWMSFLGRKSSERFGNVMDLIRHVDRDYDGSISRIEMRHFFSVFGLDAKVADRCFGQMRKPGEPEVDYMDFMRAIAPHLDLPGVEAVLSQGGGAGGKRIPVKQRMGSHPPLAGHEGSGPSEEMKAMLEQRQQIRDLRAMMKDIGVKLQLKFRHARDAFRGLDLDKDGRVSPSEMRAFLRGFGYPPEAADGLFAMLDEEGTGEIDFAHFMSHFDNVVMPAGRIAPRGKADPFQDRKINKDVAEIVHIVGELLFTKYKKVSEAFRMLNTAQDGMLNRDELRAFFRSINMPMDKADRLFQALDMDLTGLVQYEAFMSLMGPSIAPGANGPAAKQPTLWRLS